MIRSSSSSSLVAHRELSSCSERKAEISFWIVAEAESEDAARNAAACLTLPPSIREATTGRLELQTKYCPIIQHWESRRQGKHRVKAKQYNCLKE